MQPNAKPQTEIDVMHANSWLPASLSLRHLFAGLLLALYAGIAYQLMQLPDNWLGAAAGLLLAIIGLLWVGKSRQLLLTALVVAIPLVGFDFSLYYNEKLGGDHRIAASLLDFALLALAGEYVLTRPAGQRRALQPRELAVLMAALFVLGLVSLNFAHEPSLTMFELIRLGRMIVLALVVAKCVQKGESLNRVIMVLFLMTIAEGFLGYAQRISGGQLGIKLIGEPEHVLTQELNGGTAIRVGGTFNHANQFARFLGLVLPLALAVTIGGERRKYRLLAGAALLIGGGALVVTLSRAAWIGVTLGSALVFAMLIRRPALRVRAMRSLWAVLAAVTLFVLVNLNTIVARFTTQDAGSFATRAPMANIALQIIADHPWGVGFGNYRLWLPKYGDPAVPFTFQAKVHSVYLLVAAELGVVSLIVFLALLAFVFTTSLSLSRRLPPDAAMVAIGIAGGLLAFSIHGLVDYEEIARIPILWFQIGLLAALAGNHREAQRANAGPARLEANPPCAGRRLILQPMCCEKNWSV